MINIIDDWFRIAAERFHEQVAVLNALDQAIGDGDHGTNMDRGFAAILAQLEADSPQGDDERSIVAVRLRTAGRTLISTVGGAAGPLYGTAFLRAGSAVTSAPSEAESAVVLSALESAINGIRGIGKSTAGEKTMLDALIPALEAGRASATEGAADAIGLLRAMTEAADAGAVSTIGMLATKGRASYLGERSVGHQDPGATSSALLLHALADAAAGHGLTPPRPVLVGQAGSPGIGVGRVLFVGDSFGRAGDARRSPQESHEAVHDEAAEMERLRAALSAAARDLTALAAQTSDLAGDEVGAIFEAQAQFARDPIIVAAAFDAVAAGSSADAAIVAAAGAQADQLAAVADDYFRERAADIRDVGQRVAALVRGDSRPDLWHADGRPAVLLATDLDPSAVAGLRRELVAGIALAGGAPTGHTAIVARALGIPLILGLGPAVASVPADAMVAVDGSGGRLLVEPSDYDVASLVDGATRAYVGTGAFAESHGIVLAANVASALEVEAAVKAGAQAIGLVRTELLFLGHPTPPSVADQQTTYARIVARASGLPVVFRTFDVGGDKPAAWQPGSFESNPALGVRGIRLGLRHPEVLQNQLRALVGAVGNNDLRVMFPMVATAEELGEARAHLDAAIALVGAETGRRPRTVRVGVMVEVPSAAIMAETLTEAADFFSIGTNDLVQYTLAADRTNSDLGEFPSPLQPAVLRLIDAVVRAARTGERHVAVCGEAAADRSVVPLLVGLGVHELSVSPGSIDSVRGMLSDLDPAACRDLAHDALRASTLREVRALLV